MSWTKLHFAPHWQEPFLKAIQDAMIAEYVPLVAVTEMRTVQVQGGLRLRSICKRDVVGQSRGLEENSCWNSSEFR